MGDLLLTAKQKLEDAIYLEYMALIKDSRNSKVEAAKVIMERHNIFAISTIYGIVKRVEKRYNISRKK